MVRSCLQGLHDGAHQADVGEYLLAEHLLFFQHPGLGKVAPFLRQDQVPFLRIRQAEQVCGFHHWQQLIQYQAEVAPELAEVLAVTVCMHPFHQPRHLADRYMRQGLVGLRSRCQRSSFRLGQAGFQQGCDILLGAGHDAVDEVHEICVGRGVGRALVERQARQFDADAPGVGSQSGVDIEATSR
jgi:hypothetical protein